MWAKLYHLVPLIFSLTVLMVQKIPRATKAVEEGVVPGEEKGGQAGGTER